MTIKINFLVCISVSADRLQASPNSPIVLNYTSAIGCVLGAGVHPNTTHRQMARAESLYRDSGARPRARAEALEFQFPILLGFRARDKLQPFLPVLLCPQETPTSLDVTCQLSVALPKSVRNRAKQHRSRPRKALSPQHLFNGGRLKQRQSRELRVFKIQFNPRTTLG